jgi:hypothetical protein
MEAKGEQRTRGQGSPEAPGRRFRALAQPRHARPLVPRTQLPRRRRPRHRRRSTAVVHRRWCSWCPRERSALRPLRLNRSTRGGPRPLPWPHEIPESGISHWFSGSCPQSGIFHRCEGSNPPSDTIAHLTCAYSCPHSGQQAKRQVTGALVQVSLGHQPFAHGPKPPGLRPTRCGAPCRLLSP